MFKFPNNVLNIAILKIYKILLNYKNVNKILNFKTKFRHFAIFGKYRQKLKKKNLKNLTEKF